MKYENKEAFEQVNMFGTGTPNTAYAKFFIDDSFLNPLTDPKGSLFAANVTFEPACRNNWHIHHAKSGGGQLLLCTDGLSNMLSAGQMHDLCRSSRDAKQICSRLIAAALARGARDNVTALVLFR